LDQMDQLFHSIGRSAFQHLRRWMEDLAQPNTHTLTYSNTHLYHCIHMLTPMTLGPLLPPPPPYTTTYLGHSTPHLLIPPQSQVIPTFPP
jgi:hypothetical protein